MSFVLEGVDYSAHSPGTPSADALKAAGKHFVCCYIVDAGDWRVNTPTEIAALVAGGIEVVANWEGTADRMQAGHDAGVADAQNAQANLIRLGLPPNQPIYFSADWDATPGDQTAIDAYLQGAASVLGASRVGVYGGYWVVKRCAENKTAAWFWQTVAWSGGQLHPAAHLYQYAYNQYIQGVNVDLTQALQPHYGQRGDFVVPPVPLTVGGTASVTANGLNLRSAAGLAASVAKLMATGDAVTILAGPQTADGYTWWQVRDTGGATGWCAGEYLAGLTVPATPAAPSYGKAQPVPGDVKDQIYHGTQLYAFQRPMVTARDGVAVRVAASPGAQPAGALLGKDAAVQLAYICRSGSDGQWWGIADDGCRIRLDDLTPQADAKPPAPAPTLAGEQQAA